jgi:hypothetical protein
MLKVGQTVESVMSVDKAVEIAKRIQKQIEHDKGCMEECEWVGKERIKEFSQEYTDEYIAIQVILNRLEELEGKE